MSLISHLDVKGSCLPCIFEPNAPWSQPTNGLLGEIVMADMYHTSICMTGLFTGSCAHFSRTLSVEHTEGSF